MPVTQELLTKIDNYEKEGYTSDEIMGGLAQSQNYPDVAKKIQAYQAQGYTGDEVVKGIRQSPMVAQAEPMSPTEPAQTASQFKQEVPEWGRESPNLYGAAGAAYETLKPVGEALGLAGGAILGAPAGPVGQVGGAGLGYSAAKNVEEAAGQALGVLPPKTVTEQVTELPGEVATGAAYEMGGQIAGQVLTGLARVTGAGARQVKNYVTNLSPAKQKETMHLLDLAERHNVPVSYGDVKSGAMAKKLETLSESVPGAGMGGFRETQNKAAKEAALKVLKSNKPATITEVGTKESADDWAKIAQTGLKDKAATIKKIAAKKYNQLGQMADQYGTAPATNMNQTAKDLLAKEMKKAEPYRDKQLLGAIEKYKADPKTTWSGLREIRSDLGDAISDYYKGQNAVIGKKGVGQLQALKNALEKDMSGFANKQGPELKNAWKAADNYYKTTVIPFKDTALAKAAKSDMPDEIYKTFIKRGAKDRAAKYYKGLNNQGRDAVRYGMVENAYNKATKAEVFSPAQFAKNLKDIESATGVFFKGAKKAELNGFVNLMEHVKRSGQYLENPPTGQRNVILLLAGGGAAAEPTTTIGAFGATYGMKKLFTSKAGKRLLLSSSGMRPGSPAMDRVIESMAKTLALSDEGGKDE